MPKNWERSLERWMEARLIDASAGERIRAFEAERERRGGRRWPVLLAWVLGGVLMCAGVLLFVAAHWDQMSPAGRFVLVLLMVGVFHAAAAFVRDRTDALAQVLHGVGTVALGGGIFLAGQIFNLAEHWPGGFIAYAVPLGLAAVLRGRAAWPLLLAAPWVRLLGTTAARARDYTGATPDWHQIEWRQIEMYALCGVGSALLAWWGIAEARRE